MAEYAFEISHVPGRKNVIADYLSRSMEEAESETDIENSKIDRLSVVDEGYKEFYLTVLRNDQIKYEPFLEEIEKFLQLLDGSSVRIRVR